MVAEQRGPFCRIAGRAATSTLWRQSGVDAVQVTPCVGNGSETVAEIILPYGKISDATLNNDPRRSRCWRRPAMRTIRTGGSRYFSVARVGQDFEMRKSGPTQTERRHRLSWSVWSRHGRAEDPGAAREGLEVHPAPQLEYKDQILEGKWTATHDGAPSENRAGRERPPPPHQCPRQPAPQALSPKSRIASATGIDVSPTGHIQHIEATTDVVRADHPRRVGGDVPDSCSIAPDALEWSI